MKTIKQKEKILLQYPFSEPDWISARRRSPALRCVKPKLSTILAHCVPFPLPGPPIMKKKIDIEQLTEAKITNQTKITKIWPLFCTPFVHTNEHLISKANFLEYISKLQTNSLLEDQWQFLAWQRSEKFPNMWTWFVGTKKLVYLLIRQMTFHHWLFEYFWQEKMGNLEWENVSSLKDFLRLDIRILSTPQLKYQSFSELWASIHLKVGLTGECPLKSIVKQFGWRIYAPSCF